MNILFIYKNILLFHPFASFAFILGKRHYMHRVLILRAAKFLLGVKYNSVKWKRALHEIELLDFVPMNLTKYNIYPAGNNPRNTFGKWIYCVIRTLRPRVVIETGVAHGVSSWIILNALYKNRNGRLYSIDLPNKDTNKNYNFEDNNFKTGWVVPEMLRQQWILQIGASKALLPKLLGKLGQVDIFFHDSEHSYENMMFEFDLVLPFLNKGGLIIADDVQKNSAFTDLVYNKRIDAVIFRKAGCAIKRF